MIPIPASMVEVSHLAPTLFITAVVSGLLTLLGLVMTVHGLRRGKGRGFCIPWGVVTIVAAAVCYLTVTGNLIRVV